MSFGFSVGDFLAVLTLAGKIRKDFKGAPSQFKSISDDVRSLSIVIQDAHVNIDQMSESKAANFAQLVSSCKDLLTEVETMMDKWSVISKPQKGKAVQRLWKRLKWEPQEIMDLRARITSNVVILNAYNDQAASHNVAKLVRQNEGDQKQSMLEWISSTDYIPQHNHLISRLQANSRRWLFNLAVYQDWEKQKGKTLFCPGDPGSGKTFATAIVVETLQEQTPDNPDILITYVYCTYQSVDQDVQSLLCSLLRNSLQQASSIPEAISSQCDRKKAARQGLLRDETTRLLETLYHSFNKVTLLVDALDELPTEVSRPFISELLKLQQTCQLNLFLTSRHIPEIQHQFTERGATVVEIRASDEDIHHFLQDSMFQLPRFVGRDATIQNEITRGIAEASSGMFLLAELHLRSLMYKKSPKALRLSLEKLSTGSNAYDNAYEDSMARIARLGPESEQLAKQALLILVCAREALHIEDLTYALSVEPDSEALDYENIPDIEDVAGICAGLIVIDKESDIVKLVHKSAQEYFERNQSRWFPNSSEMMARLCLKYKSMTTLTPGFNKDIEATWPPFWRYADINWAYHSHDADGDEAIAEARNGNGGENQRLSKLQSVSNIAISLLATDISGSLTSALLEACREGRHALVELLITVNNYDLSQPTWDSSQVYQYRSDDDISDTSLASDDGTESETDGCDGGKRPCWLGGYDDSEAEIDADSADNYGHGPDSLLGNIWGRFDTDSNGIGSWGHVPRERVVKEEHLTTEDCPLVVASANGDHAMVRILLNHGADPNSIGTLGQTALYIAARYGRKTVVSILLEQPSVNVDCEYRGITHHLTGTQHVCWTPLLAAAYFGHKECVNLLLYHAQRNYRDESGRNAACLAAEAGYVEVLEELLQWSDVELDPPAGSSGCSPLNMALVYENERAALTLIPYSDINYRYPSGDRPLNVAAKASSLKVVQELFAQGDDDVNAKGFRGRTVLHNAAAIGDETMMALILARPSIDINIRDDDGNTPLMKLIQLLKTRSHYGLGPIRLLLSRPELDINAQNENGNTALLIAGPAPFPSSVSCLHWLLHILLRYPGINKEQRNNLGQTVLVNAIRRGSGMIQIIAKETQLSHQFKEVDDDGETLLSLAATHDWSDSDWRFIVDLSPPEFMHRQNRLGKTPEQIREERLSRSRKRPSLP